MGAAFYVRIAPNILSLRFSRSSLQKNYKKSLAIDFGETLFFFVVFFSACFIREKSCEFLIASEDAKDFQKRIDL